MEAPSPLSRVLARRASWSIMICFFSERPHTWDSGNPGGGVVTKIEIFLVLAVSLVVVELPQIGCILRTHACVNGSLNR